jgi:hypothetical protein
MVRANIASSVHTCVLNLRPQFVIHQYIINNWSTSSCIPCVLLNISHSIKCICYFQMINIRKLSEFLSIIVYMLFSIFTNYSWKWSIADSCIKIATYNKVTIFINFIYLLSKLIIKFFCPFFSALLWGIYTYCCEVASIYFWSYYY